MSLDGALLEYIERERHACITRCLIMGLIHKNGKHSARWEVGGDTSSHVYCNRAQAWGKFGGPWEAGSIARAAAV